MNLYAAKASCFPIVLDLFKLYPKGCPLCTTVSTLLKYDWNASKNFSIPEASVPIGMHFNSKANSLRISGSFLTYSSILSKVFS